MKETQNIHPSTEERATDILEVIMSYAQLNFDKKTIITGKSDVFDAIAAGVNMLGEELQSSTLSLKEKEHLLREIHHRVKNNMQIISSLLNLLTDNQKDEKFLTLIKDSQNRINAMAMIHEMLYATSDFKLTNLFDYVSSLSKSLYASYAVPKNTIAVFIDIDKNTYFDIDKMIPLGLILNEILCNSLKYAFPENRGNISIVLKSGTRGKENAMVLTVSDDGVGLPSAFDKSNSRGLGMQLIDLLSEQIKCTTSMEIAEGKGVKYILCFS